MPVAYKESSENIRELSAGEGSHCHALLVIFWNHLCVRGWKQDTD